MMNQLMKRQSTALSQIISVIVSSSDGNIFGRLFFRLHPLVRAVRSLRFRLLLAIRERKGKKYSFHVQWLFNLKIERNENEVN
ncbi:hypothetical protein P8452_20887 [Trifolium repens]|nr:hypothetical protein P8452_20887 [Trifolium repens]